MPKISVLMPVYNGAQFLAEAVESILNQTEPDFEFLILNEYGSDDGSAEIIQEYAKKDPRIKYMQNTRRLGICGSLNCLLREAQGEYIARMDCDDISAPRRFEIQLLYFQLNPDIGAIGIKHRVENSKQWRVEYASDWRIAKSESLFFVPMRHPTMMIKNDIIKQYQLYYDETLEGAEDFELQQRIVQVTRIMNINDPSLFTLRVHEANTSRLFLERDEQIRCFLQKRVIHKLFDVIMSDYDSRLLCVYTGIRGFDKSHQIAACQRLEYLLKLLFCLNLDKQIFEPEALSFTLFHRWLKERDNIRNEYGDYKKAPKDLQEFYESSVFRKFQTCERFQITPYECLIELAAF